MQRLAGQSPILSEIDVELYQTAEFGLSLYDSHLDGAGVCYGSYHRPILNMRPKARMSSMGVDWQFPADLSIITWLEHRGYDYELMTEEDLHREGVAALAPYRVVLTGTHPEYISETTDDYIADGGRLIYLGGNGIIGASATATTSHGAWRSASSIPGCAPGRRGPANITSPQRARRAASGRTSAGRRRS